MQVRKNLCTIFKHIQKQSTQKLLLHFPYHSSCFGFYKCARVIRTKFLGKKMNVAANSYIASKDGLLNWFLLLHMQWIIMKDFDLSHASSSSCKNLYASQKESIKVIPFNKFSLHISWWAQHWIFMWWLFSLDTKQARGLPGGSTCSFSKHLGIGDIVHLFILAMQGYGKT